MCATSTTSDAGPPRPRASGGERVRRLAQLAFTALVLRPFMALVIGLRVRGREHLPERDPFILIANHASHLDTASLLSLFPLSRVGRIRPCAAADYFEASRLRSLLSHAGFNILSIPRRGFHAGEHPIRMMTAALERGESLILFPEGTRGQGGELAQLKPGIAHLIEAAPQVPVVPAWLTNTSRALPKGEFLPVPMFCEVRIGPAFHPAGTREQIMAQVHAALEQLAPVPAHP